MDITKYPPYAGPKKELLFPAPGFDEFSVPEMPAYVDRYSKRGNAFDAQQTPVYQQTHWGNRTGRGGMGGYLSQTEDPMYFEGTRVKLGDSGVFPLERWSPGYDWRGGFGVASLSEIKNFAGISERGGCLRKGAPKRGDIVERSGAFFENLRPGISVGRYGQNNDNYAGVYDEKRRTPSIQRDTDALVLKQMLDHNPFAIKSHAAIQAQNMLEQEFGKVGYSDYKTYQDNLPAGYREPARYITSMD